METNQLETDALLKTIRDARETLANNRELFERMIKGELGQIDPKMKTFIEQHLAESKGKLETVDSFLNTALK